MSRERDKLIVITSLGSAEFLDKYDVQRVRTGVFSGCVRSSPRKLADQICSTAVTTTPAAKTSKSREDDEGKYMSRPSSDEAYGDEKGSLLSACFYDQPDVERNLISAKGEQDRGKPKGTEKMRIMGRLCLALIIENDKANKTIADLRYRLTSANCRVEQHEEKLRRFLSKLGHLDSDMYNLQDPDAIHRLHKNWEKLYDEMEAWLGGPKAALTSDSSSSDTE
ncbi:hypothetical protein Bbelb_233230 [Branchiostoma belcheri]|nr:hypothetical protein Bbelb_233230 [Branchiostoma belcheri]